MKSKATICLLVFALAGGIWSRAIAEGDEASRDEIEALTKKAEAGDGAAAYMAYIDLTIDRGEDAEKAADHWLVLAVRLKNADAERLLSILVENGHHAFATWGQSRSQAVENLLKSAAEGQDSRGQGSSLACDDLGQKYASGYFGAENDTQARVYYLRGSQRGVEFCFFPLAKLYDDGKGGTKDEEAAYYWASLDARCVERGSIRGDEIWKLREAISSRLSLAQLRSEWVKIDDFTAKMRAGKIKVYPPPFLSGNPNPEAETRQGESQVDRSEKEYRQRMEERG